MHPLIRLLIACATFAASASALGGELLDLAVIDRTNGQRIPLHRHEGKLYVVGIPGARYAIAITNRTPGRVLAVTSVDGINVVTGETASPAQGGYVLGPYQSYEINGWRKNLSEVAAFYFTRLPDSYAARTDRPDHVGVVGVAVFYEWTPPRPTIAPQVTPKSGASNEMERHSADATAPLASPPAADAYRERDGLRRSEKIGTGHGEREQSAVAYADFHRRTSYPAEVVMLYYDTYANLLARGIVPRQTRGIEPQPFPGSRFVPDPQG